MSNAERAEPGRTKVETLSPVEHAWLQDRLREYRDVLQYLREH